MLVNESSEVTLSAKRDDSVVPWRFVLCTKRKLGGAGMYDELIWVDKSRQAHYLPRLEFAVAAQGRIDRGEDEDLLEARLLRPSCQASYKVVFPCLYTNHSCSAFA